MKAARHASFPSALAALVVFGIASAGCSVELEHGLDERQANQVAAVLESAGVAADKVAEEGTSDAYKIVVARGEAGRAFALLEARDLPRREQHGLADTFAASSLLPSATEDRARLGAALAAELERTLQGVPGVVAARVHLALPVEEPLVGAAEHARPTASVLLKAASSAPVTLADADVQKIVAGAVPGMQAADVSVVRAGGVADPTAPPFERVGPLRVARDSKTMAATLATSGLLVIFALAVGLVLTALRLGQLRRRVRELTPTATNRA
ncbi:MAG TPA: secretion protein [Polyangia bacterium]|nr:secretion protein [Polyangia bacterium]HWE27707.1 secretion protein [Polyangia bacterium]